MAMPTLAKNSDVNWSKVWRVIHLNEYYHLLGAQAVDCQPKKNEGLCSVPKLVMKNVLIQYNSDLSQSLLILLEFHSADSTV